MEAETVTWLVFLALLKHVSTSNPGSPSKCCFRASGLLYPKLGLSTINRLSWTDEEEFRSSRGGAPFTYPPTEPRLSMRSEVREGQTITISCTAESFPQSTLTLMRTYPNPQALIITENNLYSQPMNSLSHMFTVTSADAGWYFCRAQNTDGSKNSKQKKLVVKYKPRKTSISVSGSSDNQVKVGGSLTLTCDTDANPAPTTYSWSRSKNQQTDSRWKNTNRRELSLTKQRADEACYSCSSSNRIDRGDKSPPVCIQVLYPPTEPRLSMRSEVTEGQTITINCTAESFPQSTLTLMKISTYPQALIIRENNLYSRPINSHSHTFTVTSADAGLYFCRAQNTEGSKDSKQKKLVVKYSPKNVIVQANPGLDVNENVSLTLSCSVESNPPVSSVTWRKTTDGREEIIQQNQTQTFRVNSASPSDSGLYSCEATNDIGSGKSQPAEVKVRFSPKHTNITESAEKQELDGRSSVMLSCFSHSFPPVQHYSWYRKSQGEEKDELVSEHQNHTVYSNQSGVYYCIAQNEADHSLSDPVRLFERDYLENLRFLVVALLLLMIISVIVVNLRYWRKSVQQGKTNIKSPSGLSNEPENLQDYENISNAAARAPTSTNVFDDHTSEGELELHYSQVRFTAMPRRQMTNRDSSSSHQDESLYSNVRI